MARKAAIKWQSTPDLGRKLWRLYVAGAADQKGKLFAEVEPDESSHVLHSLPDSTFWVRVVAVSRAGLEEEWRDSQGSAKLSGDTLPAVPDLVDVKASAVVADPVVIQLSSPLPENAAATVEVLEGPDEDRAKLVAVQPVRSSDGLDLENEETERIPVQLEPGPGTGTRTVIARPRPGAGRKPGTAESFTVPFLNPRNAYSIAIASIIGNTRVGFDAPGTSDEWTLDATDGVTLRALPTQTQATTANGWGTRNTGILRSVPRAARFMPEATLTSDEKDLGASYEFRLECSDQAQRESGATGTISRRSLRGIPRNALDALSSSRWTEGDDRSSPRVSPLFYLGQLLKQNGKARRPLPAPKWEYRISESSLTSEPWERYVPGVRLRGRYVQVRITLLEPTGLWQVICPRLEARAWIDHADDPAHATIKQKDGADFVAGTADDELADITGSTKQIGVRTDSGNEEIQVNIGGTIFSVGLT